MQAPASLYVLWITRNKMPNCRRGEPDQGQIFTISGYLCGRSQRALQRSSQKKSSTKFGPNLVTPHRRAPIGKDMHDPACELRRIHIPRSTVHTVGSNRPRYSKGEACWRSMSSCPQSYSASKTATPIQSGYGKRYITTEEGGEPIFSTIPKGALDNVRCPVRGCGSLVEEAKG